jgi:hypothetical protein
LKQIDGLLALATLAFAAMAAAQNTVIVVQPDNWADQFGQGQQSKKDAARLGEGLGNLLFSAIRGKQATKIVFVIQCERVVKAAASYSDGSNKVLTVDLAVDRADLAATQAVTPLLQVIELGCNQ